MSTEIDDAIFYSKDDVLPQDKTLEVWSAEWWKWLLAISDHVNPVHDTTGELQSIGQPHAEVFFLAGTHSKSVERTVHIPQDRAILFPVMTMSASESEFPDQHTEQQLRQYALDGDQVKDMEVTFEGHAIGRITLNRDFLQKNYEATSPLFQVTLPENNIHLYAASGDTKVVSHGYWVFIKALPLGEYTLTIRQSTKDHLPTLTLNCSYDITYHLIIESSDVTVLPQVATSTDNH